MGNKITLPYYTGCKREEKSEYGISQTQMHHQIGTEIELLNLKNSGSVTFGAEGYDSDNYAVIKILKFVEMTKNR